MRDDGELACLTRQVDQEVIGWTRQIIGGSFGGGDAVVDSVAVIPGDGGDDEVWVIVKRTVDGSTVRYVEYFKPFDFGDEQEDAFFVDSGLTLDSPKTITAITKADPGVVTAAAHGFSDDDIVVIRGVVGMTEVNKVKYKVANKTTDTFELTDADTGDDIDTSAYTAYISGGEVRKCVTSLSGLDHLEGETVDVLIDGAVSPSQAVSSGAITITDPANGGGEIHAGLNYVSTVKTVRLEAGSQIGASLSKLKRISKAFVMVYESIGMNVGNENSTDEVNFRDAEDDMDEAIPLYTGWKEMFIPSSWDRDGYLIINQDEPLPLNILAIVIYVTTSDV